MKIDVSKLGALAVCGLAASALMVNQTARAQQSPRFTPITIFKADRITSADPGFRIASAAVLSPAGQSVINPSQGASQDVAFNASVYKDFFSVQLVHIQVDKVGDQLGRQARVQSLSASQLALAQTLFTQTNLSGAKNLAVTPNGISGSVTPQEIGVTPVELKQLTVARLQTQVKTATSAVSELQR